MFCPKCGSLLEVRHRHQSEYLYCPPGDMELAQAVRRILERRHVDGEPQTPKPQFSQQLHGFLHRWYCPGCGVHLNEQGECPRCGYHLRDLVVPLIEIHPHRPIQHDTDGRGLPVK